ncbi:MAG: hypothetical protein H0Z37_07970 [Firmicutes bacterium]|nr:hypothetical protein [Bacillota bacterium]
MRLVRWSHHRAAVLAAVCCVGLLLAGAEPSSAASNMTVVSVTVMEVIEVLSWPQLHLNLEAVPEQPAVIGPLAFEVRANGPWGIFFVGDSPEGRIREFDIASGTYVQGGRALSRALEWSLSPSGPWMTVPEDGAALVSGRPPTGAGSEAVEFYLRLWPTYDDVPLPEGREYRLVLTYTAGIGY